MRLKDLIANPNDPILMGILNLTPDSFSDGGQATTVAAALAKAKDLLDQGAHILDLGAESTRPGYQQILTDEEIRRLLPALTAIRQAHPEAYLSVDCYRAETAEAALDAGAHMINDIWGLLYDDRMAPLIAERGADVCIMHNREKADYTSFLDDLKADLSRQMDVALQAGIPQDRICIDPGIGFAKDMTQNLLMIDQLQVLESFGVPILLGTSRKGFLGRLLGLPPEDRDLATAVTSVLGYDRGARIFRVHDVAANKQALMVAQAVKEAAADKDGLQGGPQWLPFI